MKNTINKKMLTLGLIILFIGLAILIGLSIWLGFPSPHFDRSAICFIGYFIGCCVLISGIGITIMSVDL